MPATGGGGGGAMNAILENRKLKVLGPLPENEMFIKAARVHEGLSQISEIAVDFLSPKFDVKLGDLVGKTVTVKMLRGEDGKVSTDRTGTPQGEWREHVGTCVEAQYVGYHEGYGFYAMQVRPWIWFLTRSHGCRIFQKQSAVDIIKKIFTDRGFGEYTITTARSPEPREYCVQYNESDFDFISRLMEEEGMYYFSVVKGGKDHLMIVDGVGGHKPILGNPTLQFQTRESGGYTRNDDHIYDWRSGEAQTRGKVTLLDYNFEKPKADMKAFKAIPKGTHKYKDHERYIYSGRYRETALGDVYARIKAEAEAWPFQVRSAVCNVREMATGTTFKLKDHKRADENIEYLVVSAEHMMQIENAQKDETQQLSTRPGGAQLPGTIEFDEENRDAYRANFRVIPKSTPFRAPLKTKWPQIPGILIAKVTGPSGEEIHTDSYGRIKVQFPWDRDHDFKGNGQGHDSATCWVRVVTPWSGVNWGMVHVPRVGQEVVIQFEDGDIDRPICTGMMYNKDTMPPYTLSDNKTQMGIKTRSSKGGGADNYNELVFEDLKGSEFIRMHSEKDMMLTVENDMTVSIGQTKKAPGSLKTDIHKDRTETIHTGDLTLTVKSGNEKRDIKTNRTEKIGANAEQEVGGNKKMVVKGNYEGTTSGNSKSATTGNSETSVTGTTKHSSTGAMTIECPTSITIKCGASSIEMTPASITIKSGMVKIQGSGMVEVDGGPLTVVKGGFVMIN